MDDLGMNTGAGKSGNKTAMDFALDAGQCDEETVAKKFDVQAYLLEKGEPVLKYSSRRKNWRIGETPNRHVKCVCDLQYNLCIIMSPYLRLRHSLITLV